MKKILNVLIASRSKSDLKEMAALLDREPGLEISQLLLSESTIDALFGLEGKRPDLLILSVSDQWELELDALNNRLPSERPPILVCGPPDDLKIVRRAMQAGARDYFTMPIDPTEINDAIRQVQRDLHVAERAGKSTITAVINAKGGSGASALACNIAHCISSVHRQRVALLDLDLQFGALSLYLDLQPQYSLHDAIEIGEGLDRVSLLGCMAKHASGVHVLGPQADQLTLPGELPPEQIAQVLSVMSTNYDHVIVDLPRQIDSVTSYVLDQADRIIVVLQQSLTHCRDAMRLMDIVCNGLEVSREKILVLVNRFDPKNSIQKRNVEKTLRQDRVAIIPNDYKRMSESVNIGVPLYDLDPKSKITRSIIELTGEIVGVEAPKRGLFGGGLFSGGKSR